MIRSEREIVATSVLLYRACSTITHTKKKEKRFFFSLLLQMALYSSLQHKAKIKSSPLPSKFQTGREKHIKRS